MGGGRACTWHCLTPPTLSPTPSTRPPVGCWTSPGVGRPRGQVRWFGGFVFYVWAVLRCFKIKVVFFFFFFKILELYFLVLILFMFCLFVLWLLLYM